MRFLVDAQLPKRLAIWLAGAGHDAVHTLDLPHTNRTLDDESGKPPLELIDVQSGSYLGELQ